MISWLRILMRSGGVTAVCLALVGFAFYGIARMSVMIVDDPGRGLKILSVFVLLSVVFCLLLRWAVRQALLQALRPIGAAREATSRLVSIGEEGGRHIISKLGRGTMAAGGRASRIVGAAARAVWRLRYHLPARRRSGGGSERSADVIPIHRNPEDRQAGG